MKSRNENNAKHPKDPLDTSYQKMKLGNIDRDQIRQRLSSVQYSLEHSLEVPEKKRKEILQSRARTLSQEPQEEDTTQIYIEVLEFMLAYERYGIDSSFIREVYPLRELTPVPCTPAFILGIINIRGKILSILDIKKFFDIPEKGLTDLNKIIVLHSDKMKFGILADVIIGMRKVSLDKLQPPLPTLTGIREEYSKGVTEDSMVVLDAFKILSDKKIVLHEEVERR